MRILTLLCAFFISLTSSANVVQNFTFISQVQEQRFHQLIGELRCLVCQNQSLADSNAPLAMDLKNVVRTQIREGHSDEEIKAYLVSRYGDYILFKPRLKAATLILWVGPFIFLIGALLILFISIKCQERTKESGMHP